MLQKSLTTTKYKIPVIPLNNILTDTVPVGAVLFFISLIMPNQIRKTSSAYDASLFLETCFQL